MPLTRNRLPNEVELFVIVLDGRRFLLSEEEIMEAYSELMRQQQMLSASPSPSKAVDESCEDEVLLIPAV